MWLSQVSRRGCVRMRRIFYGWLTSMGWVHQYSPYSAAIPNSYDYTKPIDPEDQLYQPPRPDDHCTTTVRLSTYRSKIQGTNSG